TPKKPIIEDKSLQATIFNNYFGRRPSNSIEYENFLEELSNRRIFLIDISNEPLKIRDKNGLHKENIKKLISRDTLEYLNKRINKLECEQLIFLIPRTYYRNILIEKFPKTSFLTWNKLFYQIFF
ncbi:unnamed protein product, partial [marine sediment metagenome]